MRVGEALKHVDAFAYWNLIDELLSQRHQDPMVANAIEVVKEILSKNNNLDRGDKRDLIQKNNLQQV